ncbi:MAG: 6-bladed beta-propeller [Hyphomicrobiaceae bacterium]
MASLIRLPAARTADLGKSGRRGGTMLGVSGRCRWALRLAWSNLALLGLMAACAAPPTISPGLEPEPQARVWPAPPEPSRYAFAGFLVGERNFFDESASDSDAFTSAFRWLVGLTSSQQAFKELQRPIGGMVDDLGRVLVADASRKAVLVFDIPNKRFLEWRAATEKTGFESPVAIASDGGSGFYVTDSEAAEVYHLNSDGEPIGKFGRGVLTRPTGIARDPQTGTIYVADTVQNNIRLFGNDGTPRDTLGSRGKDPGQFNAPTHLTFSDSRLFVTDTLNFRIQVFDRTGDGHLTFGRLGLYVGDLTRPKGVAVARDGRIYVVESYYDHLLVFDPDGQFLLPIGGTGQGIGEFYLPAGVWTDNLGRVYVADMFNGRVAVFKELTSL